MRPSVRIHYYPLKMTSHQKPKVSVKSPTLSFNTMTFNKQLSTWQWCHQVALASVAFLGLAALSYHQLRAAAPSSSSSVNDVVGLSGSTWWDPITQCTNRFQEVMDNDLGGGWM